MLGKLKGLAKEVAGKVIENRPKLATGAAIGALGLTIYLAITEGEKVRKGLKARKRKIDEVKADEDISEEEKAEEIKIANQDCIKEIGIPAAKIAGAALLTAGLIISIDKAHSAIESTLIAGYQVAVGKQHGYEKILPEVVGEKKAEEIRKTVSAKTAEDMASGKQPIPCIFPESACECKDIYGNVWYGTYNDIEEARNNINNDILDGDEVTLNQFYDYLPNCNRTVIGDDMVFDPKCGKVVITYHTEMNELTHRPTIVIDYDCAPRCVSDKYMQKYEEGGEGPGISQIARRLNRW